MNDFSMHVATRKGDMCKVRQHIEAGVSVDNLFLGQTPLHKAIFEGQYEVAALLIDSKCNINLKGHCGVTPVMCAAVHGRKDFVRFLLHRGAQVNCVDEKGWSLLHWASYHTGWTDIARLILDNGEADLNAVAPGLGTPLLVAAQHGDEEVTALLIQAGADVNRSNMHGRTALHEAVERDRTRVIQILLEKEGLDISPQDVDGYTPLHVACRYSCREVIKQLLDAGANINMKDNYGETALSEGIRRWKLTHKEIRLFVQKGVFLENFDYQCISWNPFLKETVLKDVELCAQSVVSKFHRQSLPTLYSIAYFARRLPNVDNFKLGARQIDEVKNLVECDIERNTFCNLVKVHPISLSALCVLSLITCQSGKKRSASPDFGHTPFKKNCITKLHSMPFLNQ